MKKPFTAITRITLFSMLFVSFGSQAYTSIALIPGYGTQSFYRSSNYASQKEADASALDGCRVESREHGIGHLAKKCIVKDRARGPGYGAVVLGEDGLAWTTGYADVQAAVDEAYARCIKTNKNCQENGISSWLDEAGYPVKNASKNPEGNSCKPLAGKILRYVDKCINGDCARTFENGCTKRFQATYCYDALKGSYNWKPDGC